MSRSFLRFAALCLSVGGMALVTGCATPANSDNMTVRAAAATDLRSSTPEVLRSNIAVKDVTGGKETNPMWVSNVSSSDFEKALEESLRSVGLLAGNRQSGRLQLVAHLEKVDQPILGFDMTVTTTVQYMLIDRASGKTVWESKIVTPFTAKIGDAFAGYERLRLANEGSVRQNLTKLVGDLVQLKAADISVK